MYMSYVNKLSICQMTFDLTWLTLDKIPTVNRQYCVCQSVTHYVVLVKGWQVDCECALCPIKNRIFDQSLPLCNSIIFAVFLLTSVTTHPVKCFPHLRFGKMGRPPVISTISPICSPKRNPVISGNILSKFSYCFSQLGLFTNGICLTAL